MWLALAACKDGQTPTDGLDAGLDQGVVAAVRTLGGERFLDAGVVAGGGDDAVPDASSLTYFYELAPGRAPVFGDAPGFATAISVVDVPPDAFAAADLRPLPIRATATSDAASGGALDVEGISVTVPAGALVDRALAPVDGPVGWSGLRATEADRAGLPGDARILSNDDQVAPLDAFELWFLAGTDSGGEDVRLADDLPATVVVPLPAGSPLLAAPRVVATVFSRSTGYWTSAGAVAVDPGARTATFEMRSLGWWALGVEVADRACVPGTVAGSGGPIPGAEVRVHRQGVLGVDRATSDEQGRICLPTGPGAATWSAIAFARGLSEMATGSGDLELSEGFTLALDRWPDGDGDGAFGGPGGDCDDDDPRVSPSPLGGDGSWCGSDW